MKSRYRAWAHYLALFNIAFAVFIILWGAWVRLSGSGAGCGEHWPLCNGDVIPLDASIKTLIEYTHRVTSGIFGLSVLAMAWLAYRGFQKAHNARKSCVYALLFTIIEALIGAVLVKKGLVDQDASSTRAFVIGLHLINTFILLSSLVASAWFSRKIDVQWQYKGELLSAPEKAQLLAVIVLFLLVGASGAITALGNTLFPDADLASGLARDFSADAPFLIRLRIYHPMMAIGLVLVLIRSSLSWSQSGLVRRSLSRWLLILSIVSLAFGVLNWLLMAPAWGALLHLALADFLWMILMVNLFELLFKKV